MWLFTTIGAFSVVCDQRRPGNLLVRARESRHLEALRRRFTFLHKKRIQHTPDRDYCCRMSILQKDWAVCVSNLAADIDYDNFKNAVPIGEYNNALHAVWRAYAQGMEK